MPSPSPALSPPDVADGTTTPATVDVVLVGLSARSLAAAARRAGLRPLAFDVFADRDTEALAQATVRVERAGGVAFDADDLMAKLRAHIPRHGATGVPLVVGAGFEAHPALIGRIAAEFRLAGCGEKTTRQLKDPFKLADMLGRLGVPHPEVYAGRAPDGVDALEKRIGASGGAHVNPGRCARGPGWYLQEQVEGRSLSALFLGNGREAQILAFSEQWCDPTPRSPYRYGGAVGPVAVDSVTECEVAAALDEIAAATGLLGLASADLVVGTDGWWLLEINPRPGATLDIFDRPPLSPLLGLHLSSCANHLPDENWLRPTYGMVHAAGIVYAERAFIVGDITLPEWTADRPRPGMAVGAGEPVCTVFAEGHDTVAARAAIVERIAALRHMLDRTIPSEEVIS